MKQIQHYVPRKTVVSAADVNAIAAELVRLGNLTVGPPLELTEGAAGPALACPLMPVIRPALITEDAPDFSLITAKLISFEGDGTIIEGEAIHIRVANVHSEGGAWWSRVAPFLKTDMLVFVIRGGAGFVDTSGIAPGGVDATSGDHVDICERPENVATPSTTQIWTPYWGLPPFVPALWHLAAGVGSAYQTYEDTHVSLSLGAGVFRAIRNVKLTPDHGAIISAKCNTPADYDVPASVTCTDSHVCVRRDNGQLLWRRYFDTGVADAALDSDGNVIVVGIDIPHYNDEPGLPLDQWAIDTAYVIADVVEYHGIRYVCAANHTSDLSNRPRSAQWTAAEYQVVGSRAEVVKYNTSTGALLWDVDWTGAGANGDDIIPTGVTCIGTDVFVCGWEEDSTRNVYVGHIFKYNAAGAEQNHEAIDYYRWFCIDNDGTDVYVGGTYGLVGGAETGQTHSVTAAALGFNWTAIHNSCAIVRQVSVGNVLLWWLGDRTAGSIPPRTIGATYLDARNTNGYGYCYYTAIAASGEGSWLHPHPDVQPTWDAHQERIYVGSSFWRPPLWDVGTAYVKQDVVRHGTAGGVDLRWRCFLAVTGGAGPAADTTHWNPYTFVDLDDCDRWEQGAAYVKDSDGVIGSLVRYLGERYRCYWTHTGNDFNLRPWSGSVDPGGTVWFPEPYESEYFIQKILLGYFEGDPEDLPGYEWPTEIYWTKFTRGAPGSLMRK